MSVALAPLPDGGLLPRLLANVRLEFTGPVIRVAPDDPVFARGVCAVGGCGRSAWARLLCSAHYQRWYLAGRPDLETFRAQARPVRPRARGVPDGSFDLAALPTQLRYEVGYVLQCRHDDRSVRLLPTTIRQFVRMLADCEAASLLDRAPDVWLAEYAARRRVPDRLAGLVRYGHERLRDLADAGDGEAEFRRDVWRAEALGIVVTGGPRHVHFESIPQLWLRTAVKRWARYRLGSGRKFSTVDVGVRALCWLSRFLAECHTNVTDASGLTRDIVEGYLSWLNVTGVAGNSKCNNLVSVRAFLEAARRHDWLPDLPATATIYLDDLPPRPRPLPRFATEYVMAQLEDPANQALLPDETTRHLIVVLIETGLRASDACALPVDPIICDSTGWPCLRFNNSKMAEEQLIPLSELAAQAIRAQQDNLRKRWPNSLPPQLFPAPVANPDGVRPISYGTLRSRLARWEHTIGLHDEVGQPVRVTAHQFRHTLGTRMINQGVPQHVVQRMLGHASPLMTARYATLHDKTVREQFNAFQRQRVDAQGKRLPPEPDVTTADAEWLRHHLSRVQASLPNGYCGCPPQQHCPHPNACLSCPDFQTTPEFLQIHRRQRDDTLTLIKIAESGGRIRQADNHRRVADHLAKVITALEQLGDTTP